jgi:hypothetical protein
LLNSAFAMAILDLISQVHLPSSVNKLQGQQTIAMEEFINITVP